MLGLRIQACSKHRAALGLFGSNGRISGLGFGKDSPSVCFIYSDPYWIKLQLLFSRMLIFLSCAVLFSSAAHFGQSFPLLFIFHPANWIVLCMNFNTSLDKGHFKCVNGPSGLWLLEQHYLKCNTQTIWWHGSPGRFPLDASGTHWLKGGHLYLNKSLGARDLCVHMDIVRN